MIEIVGIGYVLKTQKSLIFTQKSRKMYYNIIYSQLFNFILRYRFEKNRKKIRRRPILQAFYSLETISDFAFCSNFRQGFFCEKLKTLCLPTTNGFIISAWKQWQIELFLKWLKQKLKIKSFLGISENAVMSQIRPSAKKRYQLIWGIKLYFLPRSFLRNCFKGSSKYIILCVNEAGKIEW